MKRAVLAVLTLSLTLAFAPAAVADADHVTICHRTGAAGKYVQISPSASGVYHGHLGHDSAVGHGPDGDIIPPFSYGGATYSLNWDAAHQAIWRNGCEVPDDTPPPPPTDVCPNLPGDQATVPQGYHVDGQGDCVKDQPATERHTWHLSRRMPSPIDRFGKFTTDRGVAVDGTLTRRCGFMIATVIAGKQRVFSTRIRTFDRSLVKLRIDGVTVAARIGQKHGCR